MGWMTPCRPTPTTRRRVARRRINNADVPCRISAYGDSFTHCDQVSDGETWQEILAAHLGEPIRNYGVGAYSVYQMYLRMKVEEARFPSKYVIMNLYDDDHYRSMIPLQHMRSQARTRPFPPSPLPHVQANPAKEEFLEFPNPCPRPEDLYNFCDLDWTYERAEGKFWTRIMLAKTNVRTGRPEDSFRDIEELAQEFEVEAEITTATRLLEIVNDLFVKAATYASMRMVQNASQLRPRSGKDPFCHIL